MVTDGQGFFQFMKTWGCLARGKPFPLPCHNRLLYAHRFPEDQPLPFICSEDGYRSETADDPEGRISGYRRVSKMPIDVAKMILDGGRNLYASLRAAAYFIQLMAQCVGESALSSECIHFSAEELQKLKNRTSEKHDFVNRQGSTLKGGLNAEDISGVKYISTDDALCAHMWQVLGEGANNYCEVDSASKL